MTRWWRSYSVRVRLTLWYVAVMIVVLGVYAFGVYTFVSRSVSDALDQRLRADFYWAAATVDEGPDGLVMPAPQVDLLLEEEAPWVQVWSADGRRVLAAMARPAARRWDLATGERLPNFEMAGPIWGVAHDPGGRVVVAGQAGIAVLDAQTGRELRRFGGAGGVGDMALTRDGRRLVSGGVGGAVHVWDVTGGQELQRFEGLPELTTEQRSRVEALLAQRKT